MFVERKTHHESWVHADSVKERFNVPANRLEAYIAGDSTAVETRIKRQVEDGLPPSRGDKLLQLHREVQPVIQRIRPKVRSIYR